MDRRTPRSALKDAARPGFGTMNSGRWSLREFGRVTCSARPKWPPLPSPAAAWLFAVAVSSGNSPWESGTACRAAACVSATPTSGHARGKDLAGFRPPGGESFSDLQERSVRRVQQIAATATGAVCLITHAGVIRVLMCHCLQMPLSNLFRIRLDYGSMSIVGYEPNRVEVRALNLKPPGFGGTA